MAQFMNQPQPYSSNYYQDLTREQYDIQRAWEGGTFNQIRSLPDYLQHRGILESKKDRVE